MITAGDQINRALRLIGVLAEGETPSAETSQDALVAFQQMAESWSTERLSVFSVQEQVFTWPSGQTTRTLGPSGNFAGTRPIKLLDNTYFVDPQGISYVPSIAPFEQYGDVVVKTVSSTTPTVLYVNNTSPDVTLTVYPTPTQTTTWHFLSQSEMPQPVSLSTVLYFPPGYARAFAYNLACEIAPEFGVEPSRTVQRVAMVSKQNIKRINTPLETMSMPAPLLYRTGRFNIYTG